MNGTDQEMENLRKAFPKARGTHEERSLPRGAFARLEASWYAQDLKNEPSRDAFRQGDDFWQSNAFVGYRFNRNLNEISVGVLNLGDQDYRLSPLSPYFDIARERAFVIRFRAGF